MRAAVRSFLVAIQLRQGVARGEAEAKADRNLDAALERLAATITNPRDHDAWMMAVGPTTEWLGGQP